MNARTLPLGQPYVDVNSYHAFTLAIAQADPERSMPWIVSNYVHLFGVNRLDRGHFLHFATPSYFHDLPYAFVSRLHLDQLRSWFSDSNEFIVSRLKEGYYVALAVDEYYIPGTVHHGRVHLVHHMLVHGYDLKRETFSIAGYFGEPAVYYSHRIVGFGAFRQAIDAAGPIRQRISQTVELVRYPYEDLNTIPYEFDVRALMLALEEHLEGRPMLERNPKRIDHIFGLGIYGLLAAFIQNEMEDGIPVLHLKAAQTLVNHKQVMVERTKFLLAENHLTDERFIQMSEDLLRRTLALHQRLVKERISVNRRNLDRALAIAEELEDAERRFLEELLDRLAHGLQKNVML